MLCGCRSLNDGLACVDSALRGCQVLIEKDIIKKVRIFMRSFRQIDLCTKPTYQQGTVLSFRARYNVVFPNRKYLNVMRWFVVFNDLK